MTDKRIQFSNIVRNQLPAYVREEYPLVSEFLSQYYVSQEVQGSPVDLIQNIDRYVKIDNITNLTDTAVLLADITSIDDVIQVNLLETEDGISQFPDSYGLIKIDDEIITYTGRTENSFTGCIRGFSGITSYRSSNDPNSLVFSESESQEHKAGATIVNLSSLFLKEFLLKAKYQLIPGIENRSLSDKIDQATFIKQARDFYSSKGTDESFEILFRALYGEDVQIIRPKEYLFRPSDAHYRVTKDLVVESISGDPTKLEKSTLIQDAYGDIIAARAPVSYVEKITARNGKEFYKLKIDSAYDKNSEYGGSFLGKFSVHAKTRVIGQVSQGATTIDVDSTVGFSTSGTLYVKYNDDSEGTISYSSKNINQFLGCSNVIGIIPDGSDISINTFAYGNSFGNSSEVVKVKITSVLNDLEIPEENYFYSKGDSSKIKTLGIGATDFISNNWIFNVATSYDVVSLSLIDTSDMTYSAVLNNDHIFRIGDSLRIVDNVGSEKNSTVVDVTSSRNIIIRGQGNLNLASTYKVTKNLAKVNSSKYPFANNLNANVQNIYKDDEKTLIASSSIPYYGNQGLDAYANEVVFSGTFSSDTFKITSLTDHGFYTGDPVYYTPEKGVLTSYDSDGNVITTDTTLSSIFEEGLYFIKRVDSNNVKFARSRSDIFNSRFISVESTITATNNKLIPFRFANKTLESQKLLRQVSSPTSDGNTYPTLPGSTGILVNGTEILNYKSTEVVHYGQLDDIEVTSGGADYDVINPPTLNIIDRNPEGVIVGSGATGYVSVSGSLRQIQILDPGFDYTETPKIKITGGNGSGANATVNMKLITHQVSFNSDLESGSVTLGSSQSIIGFSTYHKFRNAEQVVYRTNSQRGIGGISTDSSYFVSVKTPYTVKLHNTLNDAVSGINTVTLTSHGSGKHTLESYNKKSVVSSINVVSPGSGYQNKKRTVSSSGISTASNNISIHNHSFNSGEIVKYSTTGTVIVGLSSNTNYYVTKIDENSFTLSSIGPDNDPEFYYKTKQYVELTSSGSGTHIFNYPDISVELVGNVGISSISGETFKCKVQPIFKGSITSVHLSNKGSGYGSGIINFIRKPIATLSNGLNAQLTPIINGGQITEVLVNNVGYNYTSVPSLVVEGNGVGAVLVPVISNGQLISVKVLEGGIGYDKESTSIEVRSDGSGVEFDVKVQSWRVNLLQKNLKNITPDDGFVTNGLSLNSGLQYANLYAPRKLREILYATDQSGKVLYGKRDLKRVNNSEVASTDHSPIIGWAYDGNPIYGPYGYITKKGGIISQMKSGYKLELKQNRPSLTDFPEGFFVEDYTHFEVNDETVLDKNNGRFCVTPEFPNGTYAYFATINPANVDSSGAFVGYKRPVFPYLIGENYQSLPISFNFNISSNQDNIDLNKTNWVRNTKPYNLLLNREQYAYISIPNLLDQTIDVRSVTPGSISDVGISTGGNNYKVNDQLVFNNLDENNNQRGFGASAKVSRIAGKSVNSVSVATSTLYEVEFYPSGNKGESVAFVKNPHNLIDYDVVSISGLNTTSSSMEGSYNIDITKNILTLVGLGSTTVGINSVSVTGIVTYISVSGNLLYPYIRENDILTIGSEKVRVLNIDSKSSRIRILRQVDGTVGTSHSVSTIIYENPRKFVTNIGLSSNYSPKINKEIYFNPIESVGLGTLSGVGIGTTIAISNPGAGLTSIFIPTKSIYIPNHNLNTGDQLIYSTYGGIPITVSNNGISTNVTIPDQSLLYAVKISNDLIGISTVKVGLGSTGTFVGIASTTNSLSTLFFTGIGTGTYHSFKTNYPVLSGQVTRNLVTVSTAETHGMRNNDVVYIDVNPSISTTFTIRYNDYNRRLLLNPKNFTSSDVNVLLDQISIQNHGFVSGQKVIHTSSSPAAGLTNNQIYYVIKVDNNNIKLSNTYYDSLSLTPVVVAISGVGDGTLSLVNPPIVAYRNSTIIFDLSDSSLSYVSQSTPYSAFKFSVYADSTLTQEFESTKETALFDIERVGNIGISTDAKVILSIKESTPNNLYYNLVPVFESNVPTEKKEIIVDGFVASNNTIQVKNSLYNGKQVITSSSVYSFTYGLPFAPERSSYSSPSIISYETDSLFATGPISKIQITNKGSSYYSLPGITTVSSASGSNAILNAETKSIGKIKKTKINDIGFDFPSDLTLRPSIALPQTIKMNLLSSFDYIGITSYGRGYSSIPKLLVFDGKTNEVINDLDLKYSYGDTRVTILKNTFGINNATPRILPIQNSNGVKISNIGFNTSTQQVTVNLAVGFSTADSFPFRVNDKVLIENISVNDPSSKGYNSENYDYRLFTITSINPNLGGLGSVTYSLQGLLNNSESPGVFDPLNSSGRIIPEKYFPVFSPVLKTNNYIIGEAVETSESSGYVQSWDPTTNYLKVVSVDTFGENIIIKGLTSKTQGVSSSVTSFDFFTKLSESSKVENGWRENAGFLNENIQRIQDNFYYQNFSYSLKSRVDYDKWDDAVSTLNHTVGYKKFSDYQLESKLPDSSSNSLNVGLSTNLTSIEVVNDIVSYVDLNCVYDFDLVRENSIQINSQVYSDEIIFQNRVLTDYFESIGNRVLSIDNISDTFNSNPRPTRYAEIFRFPLSSARAQKYITLTSDKRFVSQRQLLAVTVLHDNSQGYINQYARVETAYDLGSFDFGIEGTDGILFFYPNNYSVNDYNVTILSYNINEVITGSDDSTFNGIIGITNSLTVVPTGTATTIIGIAKTYTSLKLLVQITGSGGKYEFDELNVVSDGANVEFVEYGKLTTNPESYSSNGLGTYYPYISGPNLKVDFIPNVGVSATIRTYSVAFTDNSFTGPGIGTYIMKHSMLEARKTSIASTSTPTANVIGDFIDDYDGAYVIVQINDTTNNRYQLSEFIIIDDYNTANPSSEIYYTEFANIETSVGLGTIGAQRTGNVTQIVFTPLPNISVEAKIFMNALRYQDDTRDVVVFNNATIETGYSEYTGTNSDIKRAFNLTHKGSSIFETYFDGSNTDIIDLLENTIRIPNHFFVSGENITYSHAGAGSTQAIGIAATSFAGIGVTDKVPSDIYAVKVDENRIKIASSAENALKSTPKVLDLTSVGIGTNHRFISKNQNAKALIAIDNAIQSPVVATAVTTTLSNIVYTTDNLIYFSGITSFFGGDLIKIQDEIMKIEGVGVGSTNAIRVRRPWLGTVISGHSTGNLVTKVSGNYNIVENVLNFAEAPYGNISISSITNSPGERDWLGITTGSSFQGRIFLRSGLVNSSNETYHKNYVFDDVSSGFDGFENNFTLKSQGSSVTGISTENAIVLINGVFQNPGLSNNYSIQESAGISSVVFTGAGTSTLYDINTSDLPSGGIIVSVGSTEGFGYQPLVTAGGTSIVSSGGTIQSISIGNTGSGYRAKSTYEILVDTSHIIGVGSTIIYLENKNSVFSLLNLLNTGFNCTIGVGTFIGIGSVITSIGSTFIRIGSGSTSAYPIPSGTQAIIKISNPQIGFANVSVANSSIGVSTITHVGYSTVISGSISTSVVITNPGFGYTSLIPPVVIIDDPLSYTNIPLIYSSSSSGVGTQATIDIVVGQGSSVIDFEISNTGYSYDIGDVLTIPTGGLVGIPTSSGFNEFQITVQNTFIDKFAGWSIGELEVLDSIEDLFDGETLVFPLTISDNLVSIRASKGSFINVQDALLVFVNNILQVPGKGYVFSGGSLITFTEPPKVGDTCSILFYKGSGSVDVIEREILETVKIGDELTIGYDSSLGQQPTLQEETRFATLIKSTDLVETNPYFGPGNTNDENLLRPVTWCRQTEDRIIDNKGVSKDRELYEPIINPFAYLIQPVGIGSTILYVDNIRPFFNQLNESRISLDFQNNITFISQQQKVSAAATAIVGIANTISSIIVNNGGSGYTSAPLVTIQDPIGIGTTGKATAISLITSGIVTSIVITGAGIGYTTPPLVLLEPPSLESESSSVSSYEGDSGIIVGISTSSIGIGTTCIVFDFIIPKDSYLRDSSITGISTLSGIQTGYYFAISNSNIGTGIISLDNTGGIVGVGTTFLDGIYKAIQVSVAQTSAPGIGITHVVRVAARVNDYNGLSGIGYDNFFGTYSWGKINLPFRLEGNSYSYPAYTTNGYVGISTGTIIKRTTPLKYSDYT